MKWKAPLVALSSLLLTGCFASSPREIEMVVREIPVVVPVPEMPRPIELYPVEWHVITESNLEEKLDQLRRLQGGDVVLIALTPHHYENSALNLQELRRYIRQQQAIIVYYVDATAQRTPEETTRTEPRSPWWQFWQ
jgi:hypothetical protein